jgi:hypothetical protein
MANSAQVCQAKAIWRAATTTPLSLPTRPRPGCWRPLVTGGPPGSWRRAVRQSPISSACAARGTWPVTTYRPTPWRRAGGRLRSPLTLRGPIPTSTYRAKSRTYAPAGRGSCWPSAPARSPHAGCSALPGTTMRTPSWAGPISTRPTRISLPCACMSPRRILPGGIRPPPVLPNCRRRPAQCRSSGGRPARPAMAATCPSSFTAVSCPRWCLGPGRLVGAWCRPARRPPMALRRIPIGGCSAG